MCAAFWSGHLLCGGHQRSTCTMHSCDRLNDALRLSCTMYLCRFCVCFLCGCLPFCNSANEQHCTADTNTNISHHTSYIYSIVDVWCISSTNPIGFGLASRIEAIYVRHSRIVSRSVFFLFFNTTINTPFWSNHQQAYKPIALHLRARDHSAGPYVLYLRCMWTRACAMHHHRWCWTRSLCVAPVVRRRRIEDASRVRVPHVLFARASVCLWHIGVFSSVSPSNEPEREREISVMHRIHHPHGRWFPWKRSCRRHTSIDQCVHILCSVYCVTELEKYLYMFYINRRAYSIIKTNKYALNCVVKMWAICHIYTRMYVCIYCRCRVRNSAHCSHRHTRALL